jgi:UDP-N-acetylmuramoylalanine--D-glutamate ligase
MISRTRLPRPGGEAKGQDEVAVLGLARSGRAAAELLLSRGYRVYASDSTESSQAMESAELLREKGASVEIRGHDFDRIASSSFVVLSPGIPPDAPVVKAARDAGRAIVSEVEVALDFLGASKVIAVTGTNGKTTTTALIAHILAALGKNAASAGNIGTPLSVLALDAKQPEWIALEMSSFQLHDTPSIKPLVGVLTNLSPDHLDRYAGVEDYYADKARLFANADDSSIWAVNADDPRSLAMTESVRGKRYLFSLLRPADAHYDKASLGLNLRGRPLLARSDLQLIGSHNVANALAAALAVTAADPSFAKPAARDAIADALRSFPPLPHRMERVSEVDGVRWVNDSKATNVASTKVAIEGMERPTVLLLGGRHKGESYAALADAIRKSVKRVIAFGEAAPLIARDLSGIVKVDTLGSDFEEVIAAARAAAAPGENILLSPACSSYDMFLNFEERGDKFRQLAQQGADSHSREKRN